MYIGYGRRREIVKEKKGSKGRGDGRTGEGEKTKYYIFFLPVESWFKHKLPNTHVTQKPRGTIWEEKEDS